MPASLKFALAAALFLWAGAASAQPATPVAPTDDAIKFATASDTLGGKIFAALHAARPNETLVISPATNSAALALLAQGAKGPTAEAFETGLGLKAAGLKLSDTGAAYAAARPVTNADSGVTVAMAQGVWATPSTPIDPAFAAAQGKTFEAEIAALDFKAPDAIKTINVWVDKRTAGKIPSLLMTLDPETQLALVSALYFKAPWADRFDVTKTKDEAFTRADGRKITVPMMHREWSYDYAETPEFQAVALPYRDRRFELVAVLPKGKAPLAADWADKVINARYVSTRGEVDLPRMKLAWTGELLDTLRMAGLADALGPSADYTGLSTAPLRVSSVVHAATFVVDEEGAEAAAATAILAARSATAPPKPFRWTGDRPFLFILRDRLTGLPLFEGYVADPGTGKPAQ